MAYGRFFKPGHRNEQAVSFGRFAVAKEYRGRGLAREIFQSFLGYSATHYPEADIILSAQYYIRAFYEPYGFKCMGDIYKEAQIDHIKMLKEIDISLTK